MLLLCNTECNLPVIQKRAKPTGADVIQNNDQQMLTELECVRKLSQDLPHAVDPLKENRAPIRLRMIIFAVTDSLGEFVSKAQPFLLDQNFEPSDSSVVRIEHEHS
jgi:hypothetical protein